MSNQKEPEGSQKKGGTWIEIETRGPIIEFKLDDFPSEKKYLID